jgi:GntR family transcriptional repressor for pyruvate dehydrogenase complex
MPASDRGTGAVQKKVNTVSWERPQDVTIAGNWAETIPVQRAENFSLSGHIIAQIRAALFAERLRPGDFLGSEASIAEKFGVSRMAARDALRSLEALGIVTIRQGARGGVCVSQGDLDRLANALAVQIILIGVSKTEIVNAQAATEVVTAELAALHATAGDIAALKKLIGEAEAAVDEVETWVDTIIRFHVAVAEASHNRALVSQIKAYMQVLRPGYLGSSKRGMAAVNGRYRNLVEAITRRNPDAARAVMAAHMSFVRERAQRSAD